MFTLVILMIKRKNLKEIPHNITKNFFGTGRYHNGGYMGDWLLNAAKHLNLAEVSLDVMNATLSPRKIIYTAVDTECSRIKGNYK